MFKKIKLNNINDYFKPLYAREEYGVYFSRIISYGNKTKEFLEKYLYGLEKNTIYINDGLKNPEPEKIEFFRKILKNQFELNIKFFMEINSKLFPQLERRKSKALAGSIFDVLYEMGWTLRCDIEYTRERLYIRIMCLFYYDFQDIINFMDPDETIKILYKGNISKDILNILKIFSKIGCDIVMILTRGDIDYKKIDPNPELKVFLDELKGAVFLERIDSNSEISDIFFCNETEKFPKKFIIRKNKNILKQEEQLKIIIRKTKISQHLNTNKWIDDNVYSSALKKYDERGNNNNTFYNIFVQIKGVEDADTYTKRLTEWKIELDAASKKVITINKKIQEPSLHEKEDIEVEFYKNNYELIAHLSQKISFEKLPIIEKMIRKAFIKLMSEKIRSRIETLTNSAICVLCWIKRFIPFLFVDRNLKNYPVFIYYNANISHDEAVFLRLLSRLPVDVFILSPNLSISSIIKDDSLLKIKYDNSISADIFPRYADEIKFVITDRNLEHTLEDSLADTIYKDTNMNENYQYVNHRFRDITTIVQKDYPQEYYSFWKKFNSLWNKDAQSRPDFKSSGNKITVPIICIEFVGIPNSGIDDYWRIIKRLLSDNCVFLKKFPYIKNKYLSIDKNLLSSFIINGEIQKEKILNDPSYKYKYLRKETQEYMLNALQELLDSKIIKNTFMMETEYKIIDIALNLNAKFIDLINSYDFTKKIPKLICINAFKCVRSLEDSILLDYIKQLGFDIAFFSPAGYEKKESYLKKDFFIVYEIGQYKRGLIVPDFDKIELPEEKDGTIKKIFRSIGILKKYV